MRAAIGLALLISATGCWRQDNATQAPAKSPAARVKQEVAVAVPPPAVAAEETAGTPPQDDDGDERESATIAPMTAEQQQKLLGTRLDGGMSFTFAQFANMFLVSSQLKLGVGVALVTPAKEVAEAALDSPFPASYRPTLREFLDAIALQTRSQWKYDSSGKYLDSEVEHKEPVQGLAFFAFTPTKRPKPFQVTLAEGWKALDKGHWMMYVPPSFPVGMDICEMGSYSADKPATEKELLLRVPTDVSLHWARRLQQSPDPKTLKPAKVGPYDAVHFEFTMRSPQGQEVHWRQWVFMVDKKCYAVISTIFPQLEAQIYPDVKAMIASFEARPPGEGDQAASDEASSAEDQAAPQDRVPGAPPLAERVPGAQPLKTAVPGAPPPEASVPRTPAAGFGVAPGAAPAAPSGKVAGAAADDSSAVAALQRLGGAVLLHQGQRVYNVTLAGSRASDQTLELLATFRDLEFLTLKGCKITDQGLARLKGLSRLRVLDLDATDVSDAGLAELTAVPTLESVSLAGTRVTDAGLEQLASLPRLDRLFLGRRPVESYSIQTTASGPRQVPHVPAGHRTETRITAEGLNVLAGMQRLKALDLRGAEIDDRDLVALAGLVNLENLNLDGVGVTDAGVEHLLGLTKLKYLSLSETKIGDAALATLSKIGSLETLMLAKTTVTNEGLESLRGLTKLQHLFLGGTAVDRAGVVRLQQAIRGLRNVDYPGKPNPFAPGGAPRFAEIEEVGGSVQANPKVQAGPAWWVNFTGAQVGDDVVDRLQVVVDSHFGYLSMVSLTGTDVTDDIWERLAAFPTLEFIDLSNTGVTGAGVDHLRRLPNLKFLILSGTQISDDALAGLAGLATLESLSLARTEVGDAAGGHFTQLPALRGLQLGASRITDNGLAALAGLRRLEALDLEACPISDAGVRQLAAVTRLSSLTLSETEITGATLKELAGLPQLQWLNVSQTPLSEQGVQAIAELKHLVRLDLTHTLVGDEVVPSLASMAGLKQLQLTGSNFTRAGYDSLCSALPRCQTTWGTPAAKNRAEMKSQEPRYTEAIRQNPQSAQGYLARGTLRLVMEEFGAAIDDASRAIELDPTNGQAFTARGNAKRANGDLDGAIDDFGQAIRLAPQDPQPLLQRGVAMVARGQHEEALADFTAALRRDDRLWGARLNRSHALQKLGRFAEALAELERLVRCEPRHADGHNARAWLWATCRDDMVRDGARAVESARRACDLSHWKAASILDTLAAAYAENDQFDQAVEWQIKVVDLLAESEDHDARQRATERLELYKSGKPYRE